MLSHFLGLRPLDRLQINNRHEIDEAQAFSRINRFYENRIDLPFYFFQRILSDGRLEVRSPGGYVTTVCVEDVCDIIPGEPITVMALPWRDALARMNLSPTERRCPPSPDIYREAFVLYVEKDKWGRVDRVFTWFKDLSLNADSPKNCPISDNDRTMLNRISKRTIMPVMNRYSNANNSADAGVKRRVDYAHSVVEKMINASVKGNHDMAKTLATIGDKKISNASMIKMMRINLEAEASEDVLREDDFVETSQPDSFRMNP